MDLVYGDASEAGWSSSGLPPADALARWRAWASQALTHLDIEVPDDAGFAARSKVRGLGPLRVVSLEATSQRVAHRPKGRDDAVQLVFSAKTPMAMRVNGDAFEVGEGEFCLLRNAQPYEATIAGRHQALDIVMPGAWLEAFLPDPREASARPISAREGWGKPLGAMLDVMMDDIDGAALPRTSLADQIGALLALAVGRQPLEASGHRGKLAKRILDAIAARFNDPQLDPARIAAEIGVSRRYLHALLAETGKSFMGELSRVRLDRAGALLADRRFAQTPIGEIGWRCGYLDPSYFGRVFRQRYGVGPREWRKAQLA
jgi:AraC-like DNA-binding protein